MKEDEQDRVHQRRYRRTITEHRIRNISIIRGRFGSRKGHALPLSIAEHECGLEPWSLARQTAVPVLAA
jgi:hypothetical protein